MFSSVPNWAVIILVILEAVKLQIPLPMPWNPGFAQMMPMAMPMQMPMPMPVQVAVPGMIPAQCRDKNGGKKCPPCPPCSCLPCTPSFFSFCSPCHKKCRCRKPEDAPVPLPALAPQPIPGPAFPMPVPPMPMMMPIPAMPMAPPRWRRKRPRRPQSEECSSSDSSYERPRRRKRPRKYDIYRRQFDNSFDNNAVVKPVLSYIDNHGDIKMSKRLNRDEARALLDDVDKNTRRADIPDVKEDGRVMKVNMGDAESLLANGQKEVVFRPPKNKKISNLSLTFQLS